MQLRQLGELVSSSLKKLHRIVGPNKKLKLAIGVFLGAYLMFLYVLSYYALKFIRKNYLSDQSIKVSIINALRTKLMGQ